MLRFQLTNHTSPEGCFKDPSDPAGFGSHCVAKLLDAQEMQDFFLGALKFYGHLTLIWSKF